MADTVVINTQAGSGSVVNSSVSASGAISSSVAGGNSTSTSITAASSFETTTTGASGPQGEPGQDGIFSAIASQAEAEAGTDNVKGMSPLRTAQAIAALESGGDVSSVNSQTGAVVLDQDDIGDGTTYKQYSQSEKTKLSGIATGATANSNDATLLARANHTGTQAASTISDFDTEVSNNTTVDANTTKLAGIESGATADQTGAEIKVAYEAEANTNAFTDAEKTLLSNQSGTNTGDQDLSTYTVGAATTTDNTVPRFDGTGGKTIQTSGYTIDDDDTMLTDGIINSTTVVAAPLVAASDVEEYVLDAGVYVESVLIKDGLVAGRNVATDGTKLDGIETSATADQSAAEILTAVKTVDGTGSGLDADLLDGNEATAFATSSHTHTESQITDLDHDATKIQGVTVDNTDIGNGKILQYNSVSGNIEYESLAGGGDMLAATYDPTSVSGDAFNQDNMVNGTTNKNYTATEKTKLAGIETAADVTDATNVAAAGATMDSDTSLTGNGYFLDEDNMASDSASKVASQQSIKAYVDAAITSAKSAMLPVGSIVHLNVSTNPNTLYGFGTWARIEGKFIVGVSDSDTDFDLNDTGGAKTVTLTEAQIPSHTHIQDAHTHGFQASFTTSDAASQFDPAAFDTGNNASRYTATPQGSGVLSSTATNQNTGGGGSHENLPPYIAKYIWQRTA